MTDTAAMTAVTDYVNPSGAQSDVPKEEDLQMLLTSVDMDPETHMMVEHMLHDYDELKDEMYTKMCGRHNHTDAPLLATGLAAMPADYTHRAVEAVEYMAETLEWDDPDYEK